MYRLLMRAPPLSDYGARWPLQRPGSLPHPVSRSESFVFDSVRVAEAAERCSNPSSYSSSHLIKFHRFLQAASRKANLISLISLLLAFAKRNADIRLILCHQTLLCCLSVGGLTKPLSVLDLTGIIHTRQPQLGERLHHAHGINTYSSCMIPLFRNWED